VSAPLARSYEADPRGGDPVVHDAHEPDKMCRACVYLLEIGLRMKVSEEPDRIPHGAPLLDLQDQRQDSSWS